MIWAVFALPFEAKGFKAGRAGVEVRVLGCCGRRALQVFEGMVRAAEPKPDTVLLLGLAGGLSPELRVGDVVFHGGELDRALPGTNLRIGRVFSCDLLVSRAKDKAALWEKHRADCVDMETIAFDSFCQTAGIPFAALKAISDDFRTNLPINPDLLVCPETLKPATWRLLFYLAKNPRKLPGFLKMVHSASIARQRLHEAATIYLK